MFGLSLAISIQANAGQKITGNLQVTGLAGAGTACIHTDNNGNITPTASDCGAGGAGVNSIIATAPLTGGTITTTGSIGIPVANAGQNGYLASGDWTTFNNKQASGAYITLVSLSANSPITYNNGTGAIGINTTGTWNGNAVTVTNTPDILTTIGTSGVATLTGNTLNIPNYTTAGGSSQWITTEGVGNVGIGTTDVVGIGTTLAFAGTGLTVMNGNVGIGSWIPAAALQIGNGVSPAQITPTGISANAGFLQGATLKGGSGVGSNLVIESTSGAGNSDIIQIKTGATVERMRISTGGNIGIGSTVPGVLLDVNGSIRSITGGAVATEACWCTTPPKVLGNCTGALGTCTACNYNGGVC